MSRVNRRSFLCASTILLAPWLAKAQPARGQPVRIGILVGGSIGQRGHLEQALLDGMRERGYVEGRNLVIERRYADGRVERIPGYARDLAQMNLDAVVTTCTGTTNAAKQATASTPIVMAAVADPVGQGLIASLARPGGNLTGLGAGRCPASQTRPESQYDHSGLCQTIRGVQTTDSLAAGSGSARADTVSS